MRPSNVSVSRYRSAFRLTGLARIALQILGGYAKLETAMVGYETRRLTLEV